MTDFYTAALEFLLGVEQGPVGCIGSTFGGFPWWESRSLYLDASLCSQLEEPRLRLSRGFGRLRRVNPSVRLHGLPQPERKYIVEVRG